MRQYLFKIKENGFEAFFVGGYVRDRILGKETFDVDIATNASLSDLEKIFRKENYRVNLWCLTIEKNPYHIQITPYRKEGKYTDYRHPDNIEAVSSIIEDSQRRDFTINALYEDENGKIFDFHQGIFHLKEKKLVTVQEAEKSIKEDPLRILRALRFCSCYQLTMEKSLEKAIIHHKYLLENVSFYRKKQELEKIYYKGDLSIIKKYHLQSYFKLKEDYQKGEDIYEFWKQVDRSYYPFTKEELNNIKKES